MASSEDGWPALLHLITLKAKMAVCNTSERKECPGSSVLRDIATKSIPMRDPVHEHVGSCSPCFSELTDIRRKLHRRNLTWALGTAGAAVLVLAVVTYFAFHRVNGPVREEAIQHREPNGLQTGGSTPTRPTPQAQYEIALLDLRHASATRTVQPAGSSANLQPAAISRGLLALTVQLPIGSEAGSYEVGIRQPNQPMIRSAKGKATIESGITKLLINIDTRSLQPGEYEFAWRLPDFSWMNYPILIR